MPDSLPTIFATGALGVAVSGIVLHAVAGFRLLRHLRLAANPESADTPPLTLWRALKGGVPDLEG